MRIVTKFCEGTTDRNEILAFSFPDHLHLPVFVSHLTITDNIKYPTDPSLANYTFRVFQKKIAGVG